MTEKLKAFQSLQKLKTIGQSEEENLMVLKVNNTKKFNIAINSSIDYEAEVSGSNEKDCMEKLKTCMVQRSL